MFAISSLALTAAATLAAATPQVAKDTANATASCSTALEQTGLQKGGPKNVVPFGEDQERMLMKGVDLRVGGCRVIVLADKLVPEPPRAKKDAGFTLLPAQ